MLCSSVECCCCLHRTCGLAESIPVRVGNLAVRYAQSALTQYSGSHLRQLRDRPPTLGAVWWGERGEVGVGRGGAARGILAPDRPGTIATRFCQEDRCHVLRKAPLD